MNIIDAPQGSPEWLAVRAKHFTASEAAAMLGLSKYKTRQELLREKATGLTEEVDANKQRLFDRGHEAEAAARPLAEAYLQEDLFPATGATEIDGLPLLASFDGLNMEETLVWENKLASADVEAMIATGDLTGTYWPQLEQQLLVSGADRALFTACDGEQITAQLWYESQPERRAQLIAGWKQFAEDLENYQHVEAAPVVTAAPVKDLPAIIITSTGSLTVETNFAAWGKSLREFIDKIPEKPSTDQEFADCKAAVAALKKAEEMLDAEEARVLSAIPDVDEMKRDKKLLWELSSTTRLALEKLVVQRDKDVKIEITQAGKDALAEHITGLNKRLATVQMPPIAADFAAAIKNKRSYDKMREAVADLVATKKIESSGIADKIDANLKLLDAAKEHAFLFHDRATLVMKDAETLALYIKSRITEHHAIEAKRLEAIKEAARVEAEANAAAKVKAEQDAAEAQRKAGEEAAAKIERDRTPVAPTLTDVLNEAAPAAIAQALATDNGRHIRLGEINALLGFTVTAEFLAGLGFVATQEKNARLYRECDLPAIYQAIIDHVNSVWARMQPGKLKAAA